MKSLIQVAAAATMLALGAQYTVIDADGHVVGTLITDGAASSQMRLVGITGTARTSSPAQPDRRTDRTFHPDYAGALTVEQMTRAWQNEAERINPPVVTGGG